MVLEYDRVTLQVSDLYWSSDDSQPTRLVLEQPSRMGGADVEGTGLAPLHEGDEAVLFLKRVAPEMNEPGDITFTITGRVARFDLAHGDLRGPDTDDSVIESIQSMSIDELAAEISGQ